MRSAPQGRTGKAPSPASRVSEADRQGEHVTALLLEAMDHVAPSRLTEAVRNLLPDAPPGQDEAENAVLLAHAIAMATELVLFAPSLSGATALDRLARARTSQTTEEAAALAALRRSRLRLLRVEAPSAAGVARLRDLVSGEAVSVLDDGSGPGRLVWRCWAVSCP